MRGPQYLVVSLLLGACLRAAPHAGGLAAQSVAQCPASIVVEQRLSSRAESWNIGLDSATPRLAGVTFYDGPPRDMASLVNDDTRETKDTWTGIWRFAQRTAREYWVVCAYSHTNVVLSRRLPMETSECRVVYEKNASWPGGLRVVTEMRCH